MNTKQTITAATGQLANPTTPPIWSEKKIELPFSVGLQFPIYSLIFRVCSCQNSQVFRSLLVVLLLFTLPRLIEFDCFTLIRAAAIPQIPDPPIPEPPNPDPWSLPALEAPESPAGILLRFMLLY